MGCDQYVKLSLYCVGYVLAAEGSSLDLCEHPVMQSLVLGSCHPAPMCARNDGVGQIGDVCPDCAGLGHLVDDGLQILTGYSLEAARIMELARKQAGIRFACD